MITTLVPNLNTFSSNLVQGLEVDVAYPSTVSMPGTGFLPVNDPTDPTTLIVLLSDTPPGVNLYDGLTTFFDADTSSPTTLRTLLTLNQTANLIFSQAVPFERARFTCTPGVALPATSFVCTVADEADLQGHDIPPVQRPDCTLILGVPS